VPSSLLAGDFGRVVLPLVITLTLFLGSGGDVVVNVVRVVRDGLVQCPITLWNTPIPTHPRESLKMEWKMASDVNSLLNGILEEFPPNFLLSKDVWISNSNQKRPGPGEADIESLGMKGKGEAEQSLVLIFHVHGADQ